MTPEAKLAIVAVALTIVTTLGVLRSCPAITHALYGEPPGLLVAPPTFCVPVVAG